MGGEEGTGLVRPCQRIVSDLVPGIAVPDALVALAEVQIAQDHDGDTFSSRRGGQLERDRASKLPRSGLLSEEAEQPFALEVHIELPRAVVATEANERRVRRMTHRPVSEAACSCTHAVSSPWCDATPARCLVAWRVGSPGSSGG